MHLRNPFSLAEKTVILTGASGRLGRSISEAIMRAGGTVVAVGRDGRKLEVLQKEVANVPGRLEIFPANIDDPATAHEVSGFVERTLGAAHGIVHNAYSGKVGDLESIRREDFFEAATRNLVAPFELTMALAPLLEAGAQESGQTSSVVNVSSMYASVSPDPRVYEASGLNNPIHYGATKSGMLQLTRYLAVHLAPKGIRVNSISPGPFPDTGSPAPIPGFFDALAERVPMRRTGIPEEVAAPTVFLLSEAAGYVNGANLPIDGGWTAW